MLPSISTISTILLIFLFSTNNICAQYSNQSIAYINSVNNNGDIVYNIRCIITKGVFNKVYEKSVKRGEPQLFIFTIERRVLLDKHNSNLRVELEVDPKTARLDNPVLFAVGQRKFMKAYELPFILAEGTNRNYYGERERTAQTNVYYSAGKTLCILDADTGQDQNVTVRVTTSSSSNVKFRLSLKLTQDFQLPLDKEVSFDISPTSSRIFGFQSVGRPDLSVIKIRTRSDTDSCMTVSVQSPYCPIYDKESDVRYQGLWQTMTTKTAMTVEIDHRFKQGFILVLVQHAGDSKCSNQYHQNSFDPPHPMKPVPGRPHPARGSHMTIASFESAMVPRQKTVSVLLTEEGNVSGWLTFLVLIIPVVTTLLIIFVTGILFYNRTLWVEEKLRAAEHGFEVNEHIKDSAPKRPARLPIQGRTPEDNNFDLPQLPVVQTPASHDQDEEHGSNGMNGFQSQKGTLDIRWKADLNLGDFIREDPCVLRKAGKRFYRMIIIVAIFYCIPVYQLILHYLRVLYRTGEYDICYYNYLCAHRVGVLIDFNHFWSNVSYIIFGLLFIVFVNRRANIMIHNGKHFAHDHGINQNWGLFYALGIALALEGVLSAAYHLCPNQSSFQFDTCFMYVIAVLILLKIYQFRHPKGLGASPTFLLLALFVILSVLGLMFEYQGDPGRTIYRWLFIAFQFVTMFVLTLYLYGLGYVKNESNETLLLPTDFKVVLLGMSRNLKSSGSSTVLRCDRLIFPFISFILSIAVLIYTILANLDFATYLLYFLVSHVVGGTLYYVAIMKPLHSEFQERSWIQPTILFIGSLLMGGFACAYFVRSPADWAFSAALSRAENEECLNGWFPFYPYYDSHDAWHFLSAGALFLSFMALLIVDDDLIDVSHKRIPIF